MLRFRCPCCHRTIKAPDSLVGKKVSCPRCHEPSHVPAPEPQAPDPDESPGFFSSMSLRTAFALAAVVAAGLLGLLTSILLPRWHGPPWIANCGLAVAVLSPVAVLLVLNGHGTGCPACGAWWSRREVRMEVGERDEVVRGGVTYRRSSTRTHFACDHCGHGWSVANFDEYPIREQRHATRSRR